MYWYEINGYAAVPITKDDLVVRVKYMIHFLPMTFVQSLMSNNVLENEMMDFSRYPTAKELMN